MRAYNKKNKPKHSTKLHYRLRNVIGDEIQKYFPNYGIRVVWEPYFGYRKKFFPFSLVGTNKLSKTTFYRGNKIKKYTIPRIFIGEYT